MPWFEAVGYIILVFLGFALVHSVCVTRFVKQLIARVMGELFTRAFYRLGYTAFSVLTTLLAIWLIIQIPDQYLWRGPAWFRWPMHGVQLLGLAIGYFSFSPFNTMEFLGLRQVLSYLKGEPVDGDIEGVHINRLVTTGLYRMVRNPMYLGGIMIFTFEPNITRTWLTVSVLADAYFIWGALVEQKRLVESFGDDYRRYMRDVPLLIPTMRSIRNAIRGD
jgi:hypothetical protein